MSELPHHVILAEATGLLEGRSPDRPRPVRRRALHQNKPGSFTAPPVRSVASFPARVASGLVWLYQKTVSPALAVANPLGGCRFAPSCSHYAREALHTHGFLAGLVFIASRVVKCGPWHAGGFDPVPPRRAPACRRVAANSAVIARP